MAKKLYRAKEQKIIGGVCAGLGNYLDVDISLVRLIFVGLGLLTALFPMVIFYIIAWIIIPLEELPEKSKQGIIILFGSYPNCVDKTYLED